MQELQNAQKDVYQESKIKQAASYQDGRATGSKGKQKGEGKDKGYGKDRKGQGKGQSGKDAAKKKEDGGKS